MPKKTNSKPSSKKNEKRSTSSHMTNLKESRFNNTKTNKTNLWSFDNKILDTRPIKDQNFQSESIQRISSYLRVQKKSFIT